MIARLPARPKVLLATPPYHAGVVESAGIWPPFSLVSIAGELRKHGYDVQIYDSMSRQDSIEDVRRYLRDAEYDVLGVTSITASIVAAVETMRIAREEHPEVVTVLGGVHGTFQYAELLEQYGAVIDVVVRGEGEVTLPALLEAMIAGSALAQVAGIAYFDGKMVQATRGRAFVHDLDALEPAWDLLEWDLYKFFVMPKSRLGIVNSSRGCPHGCSFCSQQKFWQKDYRQLSAERFVEHIRTLRRRHNVDVVMLSDEYPTRDRNRWERILDMLIHEDLGMTLLLETRVEDILRDADILWKYRAAQVVHIYVGVEATNQASLDLFKKDIKCEESKEALRLIAANGIVSECSFVLGMPDETAQTIAATLELAKHYNPDFAHFLAITPWPYSDLYHDLAEHVEEKDYAKYNLVTPIVRPRRMTLNEVNDALISCYKGFYMWKVPRFHQDADPFRRDYLLRATQVMMRNSFLTKHMQGADMPPEVEQYLKQKTACPYTRIRKAVGLD